MKVDNVRVVGPVFSSYREILTPDALRFAAKLSKEFEYRRQSLLKHREIIQKEIDNGKLPDFLPGSNGIRENQWRVGLIPNDLVKRFVEITGPVDRKMIINALNSGANVFMADFEDSNSPTWQNNIEGQINLRDAINKTITYRSPEGKNYELKKYIATLMVRPRGLHLSEEHVLVDGKPISASVFDFALYFYHNAKKLIENGSGPYFYLPKMEGHQEARLWNDILTMAENELNIPDGTSKATVLIETILAAFEMDEILYELWKHSGGLNAGRWDYLFSVIKKFSNKKEFMLPDRGKVTMDKDFLKSYAELLVKTCHERGIHAMGGMSAFIPVKNDPELNARAIEKVRQDKEREVKQGFDGTWVAHPGLIPIAKEVFEKHMNGKPNQIDVKREDVKVSANDLIRIPNPISEVTEEGIRTNVSVCIQYLEPWLRGIGCVPINNLMEDAATAEISRSQLWQWIEHKAILPNGKVVTLDFVKNIINEELEKIKKQVGDDKFNTGKYLLAAEILERILNRREFTQFLTLEAYPYITTVQEEPKAETKGEFIKRIENDWKNNPRWEGIIRPYGAEDIWKLRGSEPREYSEANKMASEAWDILNKKSVATMGVVSGHEAVQMLAAASGLDSTYDSDLSFFDILYLGGWYSAADKNTDKTTYSDLLFYGSSTVPDNGREVGNVLDMLDKIFHLKGGNKIKWKVPVIADGDTGYGDEKQAGVHMKRFIEANIAGVHFEDQVEKRCGHLGGKTLMATKQFEKVLEGAMKMRDIMGTETLIIARTDAEAAKYIVNDSDERDREFIDYSKGRTEKGYYYLKEGVGLEMAIKRGLAAAPYADMIWFESHEPDLEQALKFAEAIHKVYPNKKLAYNLSPSFNWDTYFTKKVLREMKLNEQDLQDAKTKERVDAEVFKQASEFINKLGQAGYTFNFQTYAAFRIRNLAIFNYARQFKQDGMAAWIKFERQEKEAAKYGYFGQKGQGLVGGDYWEKFGEEDIIKGSTEEQFKY